MSVNRKLVYIYCKFTTTGIVKVYLRDRNWGDIFYIYKKYILLYLSHSYATKSVKLSVMVTTTCHYEIINNNSFSYESKIDLIFVAFCPFVYIFTILVYDWRMSSPKTNAGYKWFNCVVKHELWQKYFVCQSYMVCICLDFTSILRNEYLIHDIFLDSNLHFSSFNM